MPTPQDKITMTPYYNCTYRGFCKGQNHKGQCQTKGHTERLNCPHIRKVGSSPLAKVQIDPRKPGVKDPDTSLPVSTPLWVVQQLIKE